MMYNNSISQVMIVKNEANNIKRALTWAKSIVTEQVVIDTGSSDTTVDIAKQMGAKVFYFEWCDDFAKAKNFAISCCKADWVIFCDADEYIGEDDTWKIPLLIDKCSDLHVDAILSRLQDLDDNGQIMSGGNQLRIFKRDSDIFYRRRIHEYLAHGNRELKVYDATKELVIWHTGYAPSVISFKKSSNRNIMLLELALKDNPHDSELLAYLGDEYNLRDEYDQAIKLYRESIDLLLDAQKRNSSKCELTYMRLLQLYQKKNLDEKEVKQLFLKITELYPNTSDGPYFAGKYYFQNNSYEKAYEQYLNAFRHLDAYGIGNGSFYLSTHLTDLAEEMSICCRLTRRFTEAKEFALFGVNCDKNAYRCLREFFTAISVNQESESFGKQYATGLYQLYDLNSLRDKMIFLKCTKEVGDQNLMDWSRSLLSEEELQAVEEAGII